MCLATHCQTNNKPRGIWGRFWQRLSQTPLRLLSFSSLLHGIVLSVLFSFGFVGQANLQWLAFVFVFGVISMPLAGYLMTMFPTWFRHSGLHYGWSFTTFLLGFSAMLLIELGLLIDGHGWLVAGTLLLLLSWSIALRGLWWVYKWVSRKKYGAAPHLMLCLYGGLAGISLFLAGAVLEMTSLAQAGLIAGVLSLWVLASAGTLRLRSQVIG